MITLLYILSIIVFIQAIAIIYLIGRELKNVKKRQEILDNQSKITKILNLYSKKLNINKNIGNDNIYLN